MAEQTPLCTRNVNIPHSTTFVIPDRAGGQSPAVAQRAAKRDGGGKNGFEKEI